MRVEGEEVRVGDGTLVVDFESFVLRGGDSGSGLGVVLGMLVRSRFGVFVRGGEGLLDRHGWR